MLAGVTISPLRILADERGSVMHMLRVTDPWFAGFGEVYFSTVRPGAVKAWKKHLQMTLSLACPHGAIRLVIFDDRPGSPTAGQVQEIELSPRDYKLVSVPPLLWTGFMGTAETDSIVVNCASIPHDPMEVQRLEPMDAKIPYQWTPQNR